MGASCFATASGCLMISGSAATSTAGAETARSTRWRSVSVPRRAGARACRAGAGGAGLARVGRAGSRRGGGLARGRIALARKGLGLGQVVEALVVQGLGGGAGGGRAARAQVRDLSGRRHDHAEPG